METTDALGVMVTSEAIANARPVQPTNWAQQPSVWDLFLFFGKAMLAIFMWSIAVAVVLGLAMAVIRS